MTVLATPTQSRAVAPCANEPLRVEILVESEYAAWDRFIAESPDGSIFHTTAWMDAVGATYGHRAIYLMAKRGDCLAAVLPLFEINSLLGGRMMVSVPYAVYGGPVGDDGEAVAMLLDEAKAIADRTGARCVELRSRRAVWPDIPTVDHYVTYRKPLPSKSEDCLNALPRKARAAARMARERYKLTVSFGPRQVREVWRLYCRGMRRIASLNYPLQFFIELVERTGDNCVVSLIRHQRRPIGGLVTFLYNGVAMPYFVGADASCHRLNVNNFIYLTAMEHAVEMGCHTFDFGRSRRSNRGSCDFKRHQGFEPETLEYQVYSSPGVDPPNLTPSNPRFAAARWIWPALPALVTRPLGAWLTKHVPG